MDTPAHTILRADQVTKEGWYWWRWLPSEKWGCGMVRVIRLRGQLCAGHSPGEKLQGEFIGPLVPPSEEPAFENVKTKCHPAANGRIPQSGDQAWSLVFPLEGGDSLCVHMGREGFEKVSQFMIDMMTDTPSYGDDSVDWNKMEN